MAISSIPFIFLFLPVFILFYYLIPRKWWRTIVLFIGSVFFFAWLDPGNLGLLILSVLLNYIFGILIGHFVKPGRTRTLAAILTTMAVVGNLAVLGFYKYGGFLSSIITDAFDLKTVESAYSLPLGISYFTFTGIAYILDVFHTVIPSEKKVLRFANYMVMFPKILLGPISRYDQVQEDLDNRWFVNPNFAEGVRRFIQGLGKKVILADNFSIVTDRIFTGDYHFMGAGTAWFGLVCYALQIFFDFSGYTDMAIGLGLILGFHLPENFNFPYIAKSVTDFWRRWHMTLTAWFRTYIFLPLDFNWRRISFLRRPLTILIVFLLTGLWHGAGWNFIIWGGYFGVVLTLETIGLEKILKKLPGILQHFYTLLVVWIGWVLFKITDICEWGSFFKSLSGANGWIGEITLRNTNVLLFWPLLVVSLVLITPYPRQVENHFFKKGAAGKTLVWILYAGIFLLSISYILSNGYVSFLYSQF